jgi:hypothetical protein
MFVITAVLTACTIIYHYHGVISDDGELVLSKWPYIRMTIQITLLTFFVSTTVGLFVKWVELENPEYKPRVEPFVVTYYFGMSGVCLLYYPGLHQLGLGSDPAIISVITSLNTIQTIFFYLIIKRTWGHYVKYKVYLLLLVIAISVVFMSSYIRIV